MYQEVVKLCKEKEKHNNTLETAAFCKLSPPFDFSSATLCKNVTTIKRQRYINFLTQFLNYEMYYNYTFTIQKSHSKYFAP